MFNHPETNYLMAKIRIDEELERAARERRFRRAGQSAGPGTIDVVGLRWRIARLFGWVPPNAGRIRAVGA